MVLAKLQISIMHDLEITAFGQLVLGVVATDRAAFEFRSYIGDFMMASGTLSLRIDDQWGKMSWHT